MAVVARAAPHRGVHDDEVIAHQDVVFASDTTAHPTNARPAIRTRKVLVTSQNHGFAVTSGDDSGVTHSSLYDGTVEGLDYPELRARSAQFHPEASPGPHDAASIIGSFVDELKAA